MKQFPEFGGDYYDACTIDRTGNGWLLHRMKADPSNDARRGLGFEDLVSRLAFPR